MKTCDKCGRQQKTFSDSFVRNLHEGYYLVCWSCHQELSEKEKVTTEGGQGNSD